MGISFVKNPPSHDINRPCQIQTNWNGSWRDVSLELSFVLIPTEFEPMQTHSISKSKQGARGVGGLLPDWGSLLGYLQTTDQQFGWGVWPLALFLSSFQNFSSDCFEVFHEVHRRGSLFLYWSRKCNLGSSCAQIFYEKNLFFTSIPCS